MSAATATTPLTLTPTSDNPIAELKKLKTELNDKKSTIKYLWTEKDRLQKINDDQKKIIDEQKKEIDALKKIIDEMHASIANAAKSA